MRYTGWLKFGMLILVMYLHAGSHALIAQTQPSTVPGSPLKDTSMNKSNTGKWKEEEANIVFERLNSARVYYPDTSLHTFQRAPFTKGWYRDLGNIGSPANNLLFTPEDRLGPTLGYHVFDVYRFNTDSLNYYDTKRPYSVFNYMLGSKLEQTAGVMHTQNILPNWNFGVEYHKTNSPGFFKTERNNNDNACFTTNYKSTDKHYVLYMGMVYNKEQHDENGGIVNDSELSDPIYTDRRTVDAAYQNSTYSISRSPVSNVLRDYSFIVQHSYNWGKADTTYNADSTQYTLRLIPRFSITHKLELSTEKHTYNDHTPDSLRYVTLFNKSFSNNTGLYRPSWDSVFTQQKWFWIDNEVLLNGFIGKPERPLKFSAGIGNRYDQFTSMRVSSLIKDSLPKQYYSIAADRSRITSNYLAGEIKKEALAPGEWEYGIVAKLFFTGEDAGNFKLHSIFGRQLKNDWGSFVAGFRQQLNTAPYSYSSYENVYARLNYNFNKESITTLYATLENPRFRISGGFRNFVIGNYIYVNEAELPAQYSTAFTINQLWLRKVFKVDNFYLDNEIVIQQVPDNAPVNAPLLMGRHQLTYERAVFGRRLKIATGIEIRYNSAYNPAGYDALLNKFFYRKSNIVTNTPEASLFLNFRIKRFRAFVMGDNLQQFFSRNTLLFTGTPVLNYRNIGDSYTPVYAAPDVLIRFGFTWVLIN